jgi:4a-hydroxytetrahydrobiopterin dehydratase
MGFMKIVERKCVPCEGGTPPLTAEEITNYKSQIPNWQISKDQKSISREFRFKDFKEAMSFINKVAELAEREGHHPDIHVSWNRVRLELSTHAIGGLSENDFILAAKINRFT